MSKTINYKTLLITIEHAATGKMGGIGSYNNEIDKLADNLLILLVDDEIQEPPAANIILLHQYIAEHLPDLMVNYRDPGQRHYLIYLVTAHILNRYQSIMFIDTHEYAAEAVIVIQAVKLGLFGGVKTRVHCHGGLLQLERATGQWSNIYTTKALVLERACIENADEVWFSSKYLHQLYLNSGIKIEPSKTHILGLPYSLSVDFTKPSYKKINKIVFIGRMNVLKGFGVFMHVVNEMQKEGYLSDVKEIVAIGKDDGSLTIQNKLFKSGLESNGIDYIQQLLTRKDLLQYLKSNAADSLFILPYYSDNYSVAMLEIIEAGAPLLVLDTGGNKELIDSESWKECVVDDELQLINATQKFLTLSPANRGKLCIKLRNDFIRVQKKRNNNNRARFYEPSVKTEIDSNMHSYTIMSSDDPCQIDVKYTHTLVIANGVVGDAIDSNLVNNILNNAQVDYDNNIISFSHTDGERVLCPDPSDISDIIINNPQHIFILIKTDILNGFIQEIDDKKIKPANDKIFIYCLLSFVIGAGMRILSCPKPIAGTTGYGEVFVSEADYMDIAACRQGWNWDIFRYASILRNIVTTGDNTAINNSDIDRLIGILQGSKISDTKSSKVVRRGAWAVSKSMSISSRILRKTKYTSKRK